MMFIIYFHASKNGTNLPDVKTYCNKMEQLTISCKHMKYSILKDLIDTIGFCSKFNGIYANQVKSKYIFTNILIIFL